MIRYVRGDATRPWINEGANIIAHICNNAGGWGRNEGFTSALSKRWQQPESDYRTQFSNKNILLGQVYLIEVEPSLFVANLIAQNNYRNRHNPNPLDIGALTKCLRSLTNHLVKTFDDATVHMPRIGCGLAGGRWEEIQPVIESTLIAADIPVIVYDYHEMS
jgi:O-acetyl-ADP-ribose deacetylase (regulator of RNase III)